jgi:hypothetical protein
LIIQPPRIRYLNFVELDHQGRGFSINLYLNKEQN